MTNIPRFRDLLQYNGLASIMYKHVGYRVGVAERERGGDDAHGYIRYGTEESYVAVTLNSLQSINTVLNRLIDTISPRLSVVVCVQSECMIVIVYKEIRR